MKKFARALTAFFASMLLVFGLAACGSPVKESAKLSQEKNGLKIVMTLDAEDDKVQTFKQETVIDTAKFDDSQKQMIKSAVEKAQAEYKKVKGAEYKTSEDKGVLTETITLPVGDKETLKQAIDAKLVPVQDKKVDYLSLKKSVEELKKNGWKEVK
ncbi:DUF1307 domain-containing protein [Arcanobacterium ihumii]|uniref:DUF1307 domain-containing protein n=1 Tax=Arcanobacterium ihumii TaxID=2138162 RepID=UPI000F53BD57|nr:DUF1307 domain-containing protein [Arcanobacterium ihumii]